MSHCYYKTTYNLEQTYFKSTNSLKRRKHALQNKNKNKINRWGVKTKMKPTWFG